jgi:SAM-dependent methyltransferase
MSERLQHQQELFFIDAFVTSAERADGQYKLELRQIWRSFFSCQRNGARILHIGTGAASAPVDIALEVASAFKFSFEIHASGSAAPQQNFDRSASYAGAGVQFHPVLASNLWPFPDRHFDAISFCFAIEYSEMNDTLAQVFRVLRPNGELQMLMHHRDSRLLNDAELALEDVDWLMETNQIFLHLKGLLSLRQPATSELQRATDELRRAIQNLRKRIDFRGEKPAQALQTAITMVQSLLAMSRESQSSLVIDQIDQAQEKFIRASQRLKRMRAAAKTYAQIHEQAVYMGSLGFEAIEVLPQYQAQENLVGWLVLARKPFQSAPL